MMDQIKQVLKNAVEILKKENEQLRKENEDRGEEARKNWNNTYSVYTDRTRTALDRKKEAAKQTYYRDSEFMGKGGGKA